MPLYEYQCTQCATRTEVIRRFSDPPLELCEECGGPLKKLLSAPAVQFKGTGWYVTDYARKGKPGESSDKSKSEKSVSEPTSSSDSGSTPKDTKDTKSAKKETATTTKT